MQLLTLKQTVERYPFFTLGGLQWQVFHRNTNGLAKAVIKMRKRVLIDVDQFENWLESKREG
jgi:hypothetical protein